MIQRDTRNDRQGQSFRPAQVRERFKDAVITRMWPLLSQLQALVEAELRSGLKNGDAIKYLADDLTNLTILRRHAMLYETRWKAHLAAVFDAWPQPPAAETDRYALLSDDELQSQLVGQPVIDALDRRFTDILDVIDSRLWDFSLRASGRGESVNPVSPRMFVEGLLDVFPLNECSSSLRAALLRHYQQQAGEQLGDFYAWFNTELAEAGFAMTRPGRYASEVASPVSALVDVHAAKSVNATIASMSRSRGALGLAGDLGSALRRRLRMQRERSAEGAPAATGRVLGDQEFLAVLSLTQADGHAHQPALPQANLVSSLRAALIKGGANLGLDPALTSMSADQEDAIDLVGALFGTLIAEYDFSDVATQALANLSFPYVRLVLSNPELFDDSEDAAMRLLAELAVLWDGAGVDSEMHQVGVRAAQRVVDEYHGDTHVFDRILGELRSQLEPLRQRSDLAARRAWQTMSGRERLHAARRDADSALSQLLVGRPLLPTISVFLADVWRQALIHVWLREGAGSERYLRVRAIGDSLVQVDEDAARGAGHAVAERLLGLEQPVRDCYVACGLDESAASGLIAALVWEVARPDAHREAGVFDPFAIEKNHPGREPVPFDADATRIEVAQLHPGQTVILREPQAKADALRLVGVSALSGRHLFVNTQGTRLVLDAAEVAVRLHDGRLVARVPGDPVEAAIKRLAAGTGEIDR